jgi:choline dehydrogenase
VTSYDYIVVGAGSAGCAVAARLSEDPGKTVLLLEAGQESAGVEAISSPPLWPTNFMSAVDWGYQTEPQSGTDDRQHLCVRGKVMGGSSAINAMVFVRGDRAVYDAWADSGATGWDYDSLLPYFKRSETSPSGDARFRGSAGPLRPAPAEQPNPISVAFVQACVESGYAGVEDLNVDRLEGAALHDLNIVDGVRQSSSDAYLTASVRSRPNLEVMTGALVRRLIISEARCTGVEVDQQGARLELLASEVVLSAGSIGSPQLLMLSGIGPADHLKQLGIDVVADLPGVGQNLVDHEILPVVFEATRPIPPATANLAEASLFWRSTPDAAIADLQIMFHHIPIAPPTFAVPANACTFAIGNMTPRSSGQVLLRTADPEDAPTISPNYLSAQTDVDRLIIGIETVRKLAKAPAFAEWGLSDILPGPSASTAEALDHFVREAVFPYNHASGTCRMGTGPDCVVDGELRVHGVTGLRVADASIIPTIPNANPHAAAVMIGERAADLVRGLTQTSDTDLSVMAGTQPAPQLRP